MLKFIPLFKVYIVVKHNLLQRKIKEQESNGTRENINYKGIETKSTTQATTERERTPWVETRTVAYLALHNPPPGRTPIESKIRL